MFRSIRRKKKEIDLVQVKNLLKKQRIGLIAVNGDDGYPYAVPINYLYSEEDNKIFFHGSRAGHKTDSIKRNDKVCFTVYGDEQIKDLEWAPYVQSAVVFGRCKIIDDFDTSLRILREFAGKYYPDEELVEKEIAVSGNGVQMFEIEIEHMSGKELQEK